MTTADYSVLSRLPNHRQQVNTELQHWQACIDWRKQLVTLSQLAFRYVGYEQDEDGIIRFLVHSNGSLGRIAGRKGMHVLATASTSSQSPDQWKPVPNTRLNTIRIGQVQKVQHSEKADHLSKDRAEQTEPEDTPRMAIITVRPDRNGEEPWEDIEKFPQEGFLLSAVGGDMKPIISESRALNRLYKGFGHSVYVSDFMFDISNAAVPFAVVDVLAESPLTLNLNEEQRNAVSKAVSANDLALVQGPPGTGKTTVIVAICLKETQRGRRVLIVSQANSAVDNVLGRLSQDPAVRPLRIGNVKRVDEEGQGFLPEKACKAWFQSVVKGGRDRLRDTVQDEQSVNTAEMAFEKLKGVLERSQETINSIEDLSQKQSKLVEQQEQFTAQQAELSEKREQSRHQLAVLSELAQVTSGEELADPSAYLLDFSTITELAKSATHELAETLSIGNWPTPWLSNLNTKHSPLTMLQEAAKAIGAATVLGPVTSEAISLCRENHASSNSPEALEIAALLEERALLINSADDQDLLNVAGINRRIKELQENTWGRLCRSMHEHLQILFQHDLPNDLDMLVASLRANIEDLPLLEQLLKLCTCLTGSGQQILHQALDGIRTQAGNELIAVQHKLEALTEQKNEIQTHLDELAYQIQELEETLEDHRAHLGEFTTRWQELWPDACPDMEQPPATILEISPEAFEQRQGTYNSWLENNTQSRQRIGRWASIQQDWIRRLEKPETAEDRHLKGLYNSHANVVGLTCLESGQRSFYDSDDFKPFDTVIIDEVSKATPTELLMAMMLGRKVILVGDHRQLPPMFREKESSFAEAVANGDIDAEDFKRFAKLVTSSFFQNLFESAPDVLCQSLVAQFRMHPQIMAMVNQFYDGSLVAAGGEDQLDKLRQHYLAIRGRRGGLFLEPQQHVLWIDSAKRPNGKPFYEKQLGSSKVNLLEIELIIAALLRLNDALCRRGYGPVHEAEAGTEQNGQSLNRWLKQVLPRARPQTLADLFQRGQVRINGHSEMAGYTVRTGDLLRVDARMPIGIITFYGAQLGQIRNRIAQLLAKEPESLAACYIQTNTVDKFQGKEMPIVFVSLVRAPRNNHVSQFVKEYRRINVAFSRAQNLLVIIGSERTFRNVSVELPSIEDGTLRQIPVYRNIFDLITQFGGRRYARDLLKW